jgi:hypothetical protein
VTDQFPLEPSTSATEGDGQTVDAAARLAGLTQRTPSLSIFTRRESAATSAAPPAEAATSATAATPEAAENAPASVPTPEPAFPGVAPTIGRLTRVTAADLWASGAAMASWLASTPAALPEPLGIGDATFAPSDSNVLVGTGGDGAPACIVCEVGPSSDEGLGALLRAAAVQDGGTVVWIVSALDDSHGAALSWLNRSTAPRFLLVRVSGVRIDGSASAPVFELVVRPPRDAGDATAGPQRRVEDHLPKD